MRGEDYVELSPSTVPTRNTPTCVGKTERVNLAALAKEKHPHMRGEDVSTLFKAFEILETPPHAWGRRDGGVRACREVKHPHMRGEDLDHAYHKYVI